ncbi:MAG: aldehyde dehydrogenase [Pseudomonadota bacterium]
MTLLTHDEYQGIAANLSLPVAPYFDGKFQHGDGGTFPSINPANGEILAHIVETNKAGVDAAVTKAREAFHSGVWSKKHPSERKQTLIQLVKLIKRNEKELAVLESLESGKPIADVATVDIPETIHCIQWHAEAIDKIYGQVAPTGNDALSWIVREPLGVVACVLPWNFPLLMLAWKIGPALAAGNSLIVKPAEETSMTALRIAELATEAGIPDSVLNVLPGSGEVTGQLIGLHNDIDMVSFTGSTETGKRFLCYSGESNLKKVTLECGGKNPCLVMDTVESIDTAAQHIVNGAFWNMGENCSANSRLLVHEDVADELVNKIQHRLREWPTGHPLDPANRLGAMVSENHHNNVLSFIDEAIAAGADVLTGGKSIAMDGGFFIEPTILVNVSPDMRIAKDEVFGPVLTVTKINSEEQAIAIANDSCYGLTASVFTSNVRQAHRMAANLSVGTVTINSYGEGDITTPFGGFKQSGFGGRDNSIHAHDQYTELKTVWLDLSDHEQEALD